MKIIALLGISEPPGGPSHSSGKLILQDFYKSYLVKRLILYERLGILEKSRLNVLQKV